LYQQQNHGKAKFIQATGAINQAFETPLIQNIYIRLNIYTIFARSVLEYAGEARTVRTADEEKLSM
jgi:hypothetical protein